MLPHERTLPKAKSDRLELLRATRANLDPIWGLSLATGLSAAAPTMPTARRSPPPSTRTAFHHSLWRDHRPGAHRRDPRPRSRGARLVLADGHHRFETAITYRAERRAAGRRRSRAPTRS